MEVNGLGSRLEVFEGVGEWVRWGGGGNNVLDITARDGSSKDRHVPTLIIATLCTLRGTC